MSPAATVFNDKQIWKYVCKKISNVICIVANYSSGGEPDAPILKTKIPGPKTTQLKKDLGEIQVSATQNIL